MDTRAKELLKIGEGLFGKKGSLDSLRQEISELYYYERADFTRVSCLGTDYAAGSMTSYPHLARRELGALMPALLRVGPWFAAHVKDRKLDERNDVRRVLEWATQVQMDAMRDPDSAFIISADEADDDLITFGDAVLSIEVDLRNTSLLYRNWHLRDCVWMENERRQVDAVWRKWKAQARSLKRKWGTKIHPHVERICKEHPDQEIDCRHIAVRREDYDYSDGTSPSAPFMSLYIDVENEHVMEASPMGWFPYVIPRWATVSGSQYGYSPAVVMPDARAANVVRAVLLDAGERAVNPPMGAVQDALRSDIALYPGGITFFDIEYDERLGEALRPIMGETRALPFGADMDVLFKEAIANSFFLNKLILPPDMGDVTAYEVQKRVQEHVRASTSLFDPIDASYSAKVCETTFEALLYVNTFGPRDPRTGAVKDWPEELAGKSIEYEFTNPIRETEKEMKAQRFAQGMQLGAGVSEIAPEVIEIMDVEKGFEDALKGIGWPAEWFKTEQQIEQARAMVAKKQQMQMGAQALATGAMIAKDGGAAAKSLADAGVSFG